MANDAYEPIGVPDNVPDAPLVPPRPSAEPIGGFRIPTADAPLIKASGEEINFNEQESANKFSAEPMNKASAEQPTQTKTPGGRTPGTRGKTPAKTPKAGRFKTPRGRTPKSEGRSPREESRRHRERSRRRGRKRSKRRGKKEEDSSERKEKTVRKKKHKNTGCLIVGLLFSILLFLICTGMDVIVIGHKWLGFSFIPPITH